MPRVLIAGGGTGGHLMPALALADAIQQLDPNVEPVLVGAQRGVEATILPRRPYRFHLLPFEPIYRRTWWRNTRWLGVGIRIWRACSALLDQETPALAISTGGYAAGPIVFRAARRGIPVALQEQNAYPGITTRCLARRARQIHLGFPEAATRLSIRPETTVHTLGNPIVPPPTPRPSRPEARALLQIPIERPVAFVMGGSQGARGINRATAGALQEGLLDGITVLWSTGIRLWEQYAHFQERPGCLLRPFWDPIAHAYAAADLAVTRAGAMTTAELCAWGLPSVLIPLPTAAADHQTRNALALEAAGAAVHQPERTLTPGILGEQIRQLLGAPARLAQMSGAAAARGRPNAAIEIARALRSLVS